MKNEKDLKDKIFDKIIKDHGKNLLKKIQLPQNSTTLNQILKEEENNIDIDFIINKIIRIIGK